MSKLKIKSSRSLSLPARVSAPESKHASTGSASGCFFYRVYYEDTDAGGVVYYANYLKFFERARTDFLRALGIVQSDLAVQENSAFMIRKCEIEYLSPARLDDLITVSVRPIEVRAASFSMEQEITTADRILSRLKIEIVCVAVDNLKPKKNPQNLKKLFNV